MAQVYRYRGELICKHSEQPGWYTTLNNDHNIYKTADDCRRAIDSRLGGWTGKNPVKRWSNKPIQVIGQF